LGGRAAHRRAAAAAELGYNSGKKDTLLAAIEDWERRPNKFDIDDEDDAGGNAPEGEGGDEPDGNDVPPVEEPKKPKPRKKPKHEQQVDMAHAFLDCLDAYERLDHLLGRAVAMRKEAVRWFERHVERARSLHDEVIDAECTDVSVNEEREAK